MSGHSKWSTIKRQKAAKDSARGKIFTKLGNAITIAVREGGGPDTTTNFRLRLAVEKAKSANMPKDNIQRAIDRATGKGGSAVVLENVLYEGFGPHGVAIMAEGVTDNKQRTAAEVKSIFTSRGGTLGGVGSVAYLFNQVGELHITKEKTSDEVLELTLEAGGQDLEEDQDRYIIYTHPQDLHKVKDFFTSKNIKVIDSELTYKPTSTVAIKDQQKIQKVLGLLSALDDSEDIHKVHANVDLVGIV